MPLRGDVDLIALRRRHNGRERPTCMVRNSNRNWNLQGRHGAAASVPAATTPQLCLVEGRPQELGQWPRLVAPARGCVRGSRRAAHGVARRARARARAPSNAPAPPRTRACPPPPATLSALPHPSRHPHTHNNNNNPCSCVRAQESDAGGSMGTGGGGTWRRGARCALRGARRPCPFAPSCAAPVRVAIRRVPRGAGIKTHTHTQKNAEQTVPWYSIRSAFSL